MHALTKSECQEWCSAHQIALDHRGLPLIPADASPMFELPGDAGQRVAMAKSHFEPMRGVDEVLIWIEDWGVWPSGEHMPMFTRFREGIGIRDGLIKRCGHLVRAEDFEDGLSVILFAVLFLWDCYVLPSSGREFVFYSHDEVGYRRTESNG